MEHLKKFCFLIWEPFNCIIVVLEIETGKQKILISINMDIIMDI